MAATFTPSLTLGVPVREFAAAFSNLSGITIDASGEKIAFCGYFWNPERATKTVDGVEFLAGNITDSGGTISTSIQNVSLTAGFPMRPDEGTPLVSLNDRDLGLFTASAWNGYDFGASSSISFGQLIAVVWEFGTGFTTDVFNLQMLPTAANAPSHSCVSIGKTAAGPVWTNAASAHYPNVVLRCSDGTFATLFGAIPCSATTTLTYNNGSAGFDEIALGLRLPYPFTLEAITAGIDMDGDTNIILYDGTTALYTRLLDNSERSNSASRFLHVPVATLQACAANTLYRIGVQPNTATNISVRYLDVNEADHAALIPGVNEYLHYWDRINAGAWSNETTTRIPFIGLSIAKLDDGTGGGVSILNRRDNSLLVR